MPHYFYHGPQIQDSCEIITEVCYFHTSLSGNKILHEEQKGKQEMYMILNRMREFLFIEISQRSKLLNYIFAIIGVITEFLSHTMTLTQQIKNHLSSMKCHWVYKIQRKK